MSKTYCDEYTDAGAVRFLSECNSTGGGDFVLGKLSIRIGVVLGIQPVQSLTKTLFFSCPDMNCPGTFEPRTTTGLSGVRKRKSLTCTYCHTQLTEDLYKRSASDTMEFIFLPKANSSIDSHIGDEKRLNFKRTIECCVSAHVTPAGTYFLLKWLLLLLLVQDGHQPGEKSASNPIHGSPVESASPSLLLIGPIGFLLTERLLLEAVRYARPRWVHWVGQKLQPTSLELDAFGSMRSNTKQRIAGSGAHSKQAPSRINAYSTIHCGTLELATGGVAYFPWIELLKRKEMTNLIYALENNRGGSNSEDVNTGKRRPIDLGSSVKSTSIWASSQIYSRKSSKTSGPSYNVIDDDYETQSAVEKISRKSALQKAFRAFDLVVNAETAAGPTEIVDSLCAHHCLKSRLQSSEKVALSDQSTENARRVFDSIISNCKSAPSPTISPNLSRLFQAYFLAVRRACSIDQHTVPNTALEILFKLARANAKLNNRSVVSTMDSVIAIYLYDTFVDNHTGTTYLGMTPLHYITDLSTECMHEVHQVLQSVYAQLTGLIDVGFTEEI